MQCRDPKNIFPIIAAIAQEYITSGNVEFFACGSRLKDEGRKNDFDIIISMPGLKEHLDREIAKMNLTDEFNNPVKVDLMLSITNPAYRAYKIST